ncbi:DNA polymerase I [Vulcanococcus limneticus]|uniref:DNA polymerase I n=1 Tax=Vulcanococcus limneticus TaxID=2170428 RepID=UPI00398C1D85
MAQNRGKGVADSAPLGQAAAPGAPDGDLANSSRATAAAGGPKPLLLLVDGHSLAFRSFYAFAKGGDGGLSTKAGVPTSVTYGFLKALLDNCRGLNPQGVVIAFDTAEPTFRHEADAAYKAHREEAPEHFFEDLGNLQRILAEALDLSLCLAPGYEADDVLGTLANRAANRGWRVRILSGDRDLFQLVDDQRDIAVLYMGGGPYAKNSGPVEIRREGVIAKLGVPPEDVVDLKALTGDSSDNIPGVKGVGPKTAINLLQENGSLKGIYAALDTLEGPKAAKGALKGAIREKLATDRENAFRSRMLAEILLDIPLPSEPRLELGAVNSESLAGNLEELELFSLMRQVANFTRLFSAQPLGVTTDPGAGSDETTNQRHPASADGAAAAHATQPGAVALQNIGTPDAAAGPATATPSLQPELITTEAQLAALLIRLQAATDPAHPVALDTETTALNPFRAELVGIGLCWGAGASDLAYIPIGHGGSESQGLLAGLDEPAADASVTQLPLATVLQALAPWLASPAHPKTLQNAKYDRLVLLRHGLALEGVVMDTLLADYLRDANDRHGLEVMAQRNLGFTPTSYADLVPKGASFAAVPIPAAAQYCGMDVHVTWRLTGLLREQLAALGAALPALLAQVELPLEPVLAAMEATGIRIDCPYLAELSTELATTLADLEIRAREAAGVDFNLASPKQLGELLFDTLGLERKKSRKTKTGWSTDAAVLEKLEHDHPVVPLVLEHRTLSKLRSTYVDALPALMEPETGRVHTDFNQAVTATGRLSSSNPNLQNIPIRTEFSRRIRKAFLPQEGWLLLSADYSQIELRILTHLSGEDVLVQAYNDGDDVHALTARLLLDKEEVSTEERRLGKTINFGVIYGMGAQRLAREAGLPQAQAKEFLSRYKQRYPKVFAYLELQERLALSLGYVETILGRRRPFHFDPGGLGRLLGKDPLAIDLEAARRGGMEGQQLRAAANAPIQGSSADIIKLAMVHLHRTLRDEGLPARLLLQVHDELVLEVAPEALEEVRDLTRHTMEEAVLLRVPLKVETGVGPNWMEAK